MNAAVAIALMLTAAVVLAVFLYLIVMQLLPPGGIPIP